ncbi:spore coat protein U, partial [Pseudomonas aeruginosa]
PRLFLSLLLLRLPNLVAHADPSPISGAFQVQAEVANGCAFGTAISDNAYELGTLSFGTLGNLASPVTVASSSGAGSI